MTLKIFLEVVELRTKVASVFPFAIGVLFSIAFFSRNTVAEHFTVFYWYACL